ncbi:MAG: AI-2E family transporter [Gemmatimonadota bacterium]|nr:AI-2E family transporter [Gemmatimonadota bacterium]MDE2985964.1 AI-2E family transporter [Gemmatimonadota bacterium]
MFFDQQDQTPGLRFLFTLAVGVILIQGLRFAEPVVLPVALAGFLAVICLPIVLWLKSRRVPVFVAVPLTVLAVAGVFGLLIVLGTQQLTGLQARLIELGEAIRPELEMWMKEIEARFALLEEGELRATVWGLFDVSRLASMATGVTTWALSFVSGTFLVFLILAFALSEAVVFPRKLGVVAGDAVASNERLTAIVDEVQGYLVIKTLVSLITGMLLGLWTWVMGLEHWLLLGLIAFVLNYIPTIGSVLASVPALALALVQVDPVSGDFVGFGLQHAVIVSLGYVGVNIVFGNWLEPTLMGRRLGLSTLVVVLSLVFWGWLWGPVGAVLSVPLTMVVKIMLENTKDLQWVAVLLDKAPAAEPTTAGAKSS